MIDAEFSLVEKFARVLEEEKAVRAFPLGIGVWKVRADVAEASGAKKRIAKRVGEDVAIGVADGAFIERDVNAADHERAAFGEAMKVVADAATNHACLRSWSR
jgi:hypothetical protein